MVLWQFLWFRVFPEDSLPLRFDPEKTRQTSGADGFFTHITTVHKKSWRTQ